MAMELDVGVLDAETQQRISDLGQIIVTPEAKETLDKYHVDITSLFERYVKGDYGVMEHDKLWENDQAMYFRAGKCEGIYELPDGKRVTVRTLWCTTLTQIEDYNETI